MNESSGLFIEQAIINAVKEILTGRVNELLHELPFSIPFIETVCPDIVLHGSERSEKERLLLLDVYALTIRFTIPETPESALYCYAYAAVVDKALQENTTLGGVVDRAVITGKKYNRPKTPDCGESWEVVLTIRLTVEGMAYGG